MYIFLVLEKYALYFNGGNFMENLKNLIRKIFMPSINSQYEFTLPIKSESDSDIENVENVGNIEKIFSKYCL